ncbi:MAG: histidine phosphatase family protein [Myxococcota bacterium]
MTRLLLMRHAKSSWKTAGQTDHQRPLSPRGRLDAPTMARRLQVLDWVPELALVSDSARTEETWAWMSAELDPVPPFELRSELYHGTITEIRAAIRARVTGQSTVLVLGHNPGWEDAIEALTGEVHPLTTANIALLSHPGTWAEALDRADWVVEDVLRPRAPR